MAGLWARSELTGDLGPAHATPISLVRGAYPGAVAGVTEVALRGDRCNPLQPPKMRGPHLGDRPSRLT